MARLNLKSVFAEKTYEGAPAARTNAEAELARTVMASLLWENTFYENGESVAERVKTLVPSVKPESVSLMAKAARNQQHLRHMPLLLVREMARHKTHRPYVRETLASIIQRPDELTEFLAIYWKDGKCPLAKSVQKGLADAFGKFNEYSLAKYNRNTAIKLRDVLFLSHAKPKDAEQADLWKRLIDDKLVTPDTWEVALSAKGNTKEEWERLLVEKKLGGLALIRNLRNMVTAGVNFKLIESALREMKTDRILPFRFIAAARHAPSTADLLDKAMLSSLEKHEKLSGRTLILVDVSGSMNFALSEKSDMARIDAAAGLAVLAREICDSVEIYTFSDYVKEIPNYRGLALSQAIERSQPHGGTYLGKAITTVQNTKTFDRIIVITDEQSHDRVSDPGVGKAYMINVGTYKNGVGYGKWIHIDGWSDRVIDYIQELEKLETP